MNEINREHEIDEFVKRANSEFKDESEKLYRKCRDEENRRDQNYNKRVWYKTDLCKATWRNNNNRRRQKNWDLSVEERREIIKFYKNRPERHHVDHIIPLSRGGKHCLTNLQYLRAEENMRKGSKLPSPSKEKP